MKKKILDGCINIIRKNKNYSDDKLAEIRYGLEGLYLTITKLIIIAGICILLNLFVEFIIFSIIYNIIRMPSFGLHATKSWICLLVSTTLFVIVPYLCTIINLNHWAISLIGLLMILLFYKNAPADTEKRPIVSYKYRMTYKIISITICFIFTILALLINNAFISNCLVLSLIMQSFMISPSVYKLFNLKFDNYKNYLQQAI